MVKNIFILLLTLIVSGHATELRAEDDLISGFINPQDTFKPWAYWWWLDSNASKEGITRDLEEMKRQGIAGVILFDAGKGGPDAPDGPIFMSDDWRTLFKYAIREADRLGIEVGVNLCSGWNAGGPWVSPKHACKKLIFAGLKANGPTHLSRNLPTPEVVADFYHDVAVIAYKARYPVTSQASDNASRKPIKNFLIKAAQKRMMAMPPNLEYEQELSIPGEQDFDSDSMIDLTGRVDKEGLLIWNVPEGEWSILRFGYTLTDKKTAFHSPGAQGHEIDPFDAEAMDMHFAATAEKMIDDAGALAGKTMKYFHIDSWEILCPTWTAKFREEFKQRRGYDFLPYLPVLIGKIVDSREVSNRFLWDYRQTIGDLIVENYYGRLAELSHRHGMGTHSESAGYQRPCVDALKSLSVNDIPMTEFWARFKEPHGVIHQMYPKSLRAHDAIKGAASAAHIYGKPLCQAEAFTTMGPNWEKSPFMLKDIGDRAFCAGLTRKVLCYYTHQPRLDIKPGYQWHQAGTHFDRNITWWDQIDAWLTYLTRCQYLLRQGTFVADVCYFYGEDVPNYVPAKHLMEPALPAGFDCDTINADVLLNRMSVKDGRLVLPSKMSYRMLILPQRRTMSPRILRKIQELVEAGATVVGPKPERSPSLTDYPDCDAQVKDLANEIWGEVDGQQVKERKLGKGRIIWSKTLVEILSDDSVSPDFEYKTTDANVQLDFIHRRSDDAEIYFISNQQTATVEADCTFRVRGRQPEIWDAVTGWRWNAADFQQQQGQTTLPMRFAPRQSFFVVFQEPTDVIQSTGCNFPMLTIASELLGPWTVRFDPKWGGPASVIFEKLDDWTSRPEPGIKYYSGKAAYEKIFDLPEGINPSRQHVYLDLGRVENLAEVRLNDHDLGVVWTTPWRVDITEAVQATQNQLQISVVNLWPNRLIGDADLPVDQRLTVTNVKKFTKDSPLMPSGLLGPVTIRTAQR